MSIQQAAQAAANVWGSQTVATSAGTLPLAAVMVAIAGAESGYNATAQGDYGLGGATCGNSSSSWGLWQIHNVHSAFLARVTGSSSACVWKTWLFVPAHNAQAANHIYHLQGLGAWTTYANGSWQSYIGAAKQALAAQHPATASRAPSSSSTTKPVLGQTLGSPWTFLAGLGMIAGAAILIKTTEPEWEPEWHRTRQWIHREWHAVESSQKGAIPHVTKRSH